MRVVKEIPHALFKITVFSWNGKYLLKFETAHFEQTYKIPEMDVSGDEEVKQLVDDEKFIEAIKQNFMQMGKALRESIERLE